MDQTLQLLSSWLPEQKRAMGRGHTKTSSSNLTFHLIQKFREFLPTPDTASKKHYKLTLALDALALSALPRPWLQLWK